MYEDNLILMMLAVLMTLIILLLGGMVDYFLDRNENKEIHRIIKRDRIMSKLRYVTKKPKLNINKFIVKS